MKRIKIVGLCLVATFAFGAMATSSAQAAEVKSCVKAGKVTIKYKKGKEEKEKPIREGRYANKSCTEAAPENTGKYPPYTGPEGKFEWGAAGSTFGTKSGTGLKKPKLELDGEGGRVVQCSSSSGKGEWTGTKAGLETVAFKKCALNTNGEECTSAGLSEGEIETAPLQLTLVSYPEEVQQLYFGEGNEVIGSEWWKPLEGTVWVQSTASAGHPYYLEFACGPDLSFRTTGTVTGKVKTALNVMGKSMTWYVGPGQGIQDLSSEVSTDGGASYAPVGGTTVESYEAAAKDGGGIEVVEPE